jgi:CubicO group peptidase (beta-lactamase class C family)
MPACGGQREGGASAGPTSIRPRLTSDIAQRLQAQLETKVRETGVPGASAAVVFPDGREWAGAAGKAVLRPSRPMTSQTALPFDSVTKIATAALALRLVERGH